MEGRLAASTTQQIKESTYSAWHSNCVVVGAAAAAVFVTLSTVGGAWCQESVAAAVVSVAVVWGVATAYCFHQKRS